MQESWCCKKVDTSTKWRKVPTGCCGYTPCGESAVRAPAYKKKCCCCGPEVPCGAAVYVNYLHDADDFAKNANAVAEEWNVRQKAHGKTKETEVQFHKVQRRRSLRGDGLKIAMEKPVPFNEVEKRAEAAEGEVEKRAEAAEEDV
jgi:hypothetical protein